MFVHVQKNDVMIVNNGYHSKEESGNRDFVFILLELLYPCN